MKIGLHTRTGDGDTEAIEEGDNGERAEERQDASSVAQESLLGENSASLPDCEFGAREDRDSQCAGG